jgi:hypothetical protein
MMWPHPGAEVTISREPDCSLQEMSEIIETSPEPMAEVQPR